MKTLAIIYVAAFMALHFVFWIIGVIDRTRQRGPLPNVPREVAISNFEKLKRQARIFVPLYVLLLLGFLVCIFYLLSPNLVFNIGSVIAALFGLLIFIPMFAVRNYVNKHVLHMGWFPPLELSNKEKVEWENKNYDATMKHAGRIVLIYLTTGILLMAFLLGTVFLLDVLDVI